MYIKKFEGRQGLSTADFQSAVAVLFDMKVAALDGQLLFIDEEWDKFRYDGKSRPGMTSYEEVRDRWDPVLLAISGALQH